MPTLIIVFLLDYLAAHIADRKERAEIKRILGKAAPSELIEEVFHKKEELTLQGEKKELTVLFADIWNFPNLIVPYTTEELKEFLHNYFTKMGQTLFNNRGIVEKFSRDQIMALWNAPLSEKDHAYLAVKAALEIQSSPEPYKIGIGINTGIAHVGDMGSKYHHSFTAIGQPVDVALHLKELTKAYQLPILVGEMTWQLTQERIEYKKLPSTEFNGTQIDVFQPLSLRPLA